MTEFHHNHRTRGGGGGRESSSPFVKVFSASEGSAPRELSVTAEGSCRPRGQSGTKNKAGLSVRKVRKEMPHGKKLHCPVMQMLRPLVTEQTPEAPF